jgi:hypothetical protein
MYDALMFYSHLKLPQMIVQDKVLFLYTYEVSWQQKRKVNKFHLDEDKHFGCFRLEQMRGKARIYLKQIRIK